MRVDPWLARLQSRQHAHVRLFCLPYAGGGALTYRPWASALSSAADVWAVQLPGRETRIQEPLYVRATPLVAELASALEPHLDRPYALFGHSMGALLAFALARELRHRRTVPPQYLFLSGCRAPQVPARDPPLHRLPEPELRQVLRELAGTPEAVLRSDLLMEIFSPILRADMELVETYDYRDEPPLACPISAFGGRADRRVTEADLEAWRAHTAQRYELRMFDGNHFFLHTCQSQLTRAIAEDLRRAVPRP